MFAFLSLKKRVISFELFSKVRLSENVPHQSGGFSNLWTPPPNQGSTHLVGEIRCHNIHFNLLPSYYYLVRCVRHGTVRRSLTLPRRHLSHLKYSRSGTLYRPPRAGDTVREKDQVATKESFCFHFNTEGCRPLGRKYYKMQMVVEVGVSGAFRPLRLHRPPSADQQCHAQFCPFAGLGSSPS